MKKISLLAAAVLLISSLLFCFSACSSDESEIEDSTAAYSYVDSATPAKTSSEEVLHYFNELVNKIKSEKPAVSYNIEKNIPNDSIRVTKKGAEQSEETDSSLDAINDSAKGLKDLVLENIKKTKGNIAYGEENSDILFVKGESWASKLTENDIKYAFMKEVGDNYYITIAFNDLTSAEAQEVLTKAFDFSVLVIYNWFIILSLFIAKDNLNESHKKAKSIGVFMCCSCRRCIICIGGMHIYFKKK